MTIQKLTVNFKRFAEAVAKARKALEKFGWCFCPRCEAMSNYDFSFCPVCACPKKSRLIELEKDD